MLVSHEYKFIYLKTVKTGGTSTEVFLQGAIEPEGDEVIDRTDMRDDAHGIVGFRGDVSKLDTPPRWFNHMSAKAVRDQLDPEIWQGYTKLANIRNPFSRAVSAFYQRHRAGVFTMPSRFEEARDLFSAFITSPSYGSYKRIIHCDDSYVLNDVIFYEQLEQDISRICAYLGIDLPLARLPHYKKTTAAHVEQPTAAFFNAESADAVRAKEGWCFERFGYASHPEDALEPPACVTETGQQGGQP